MEKIIPNQLDPDSLYNTYKRSCIKNNEEPIDQLEFMKNILTSLSGLLNAVIANKGLNTVIVKFPIGDYLNCKIWGLMTTNEKDQLRTVFGQKEVINECIEELRNLPENTKTLESNECSPLDQF